MDNFKDMSNEELLEIVDEMRKAVSGQVLNPDGMYIKFPNYSAKDIEIINRSVAAMLEILSRDDR